MIYTVYRITCSVSGKIYVGAHKTEDLEDGYMGSGRAIAAAIEKYGLKSFEKVILHFCDSESEMYKVEASIVTEAFVRRQDTYNLREGGTGGRFSDETRALMSKAKKGITGEAHNRYGKKHSAAAKRKMSEARIGRRFGPLSDETKRKLSEAHRGHDI